MSEQKERDLRQEGLAYKARITNLNYNLSTWAKEMGLNRKTVERQCSGRIPIKRGYWFTLHILDGKGIPEIASD